MPLETDSVRFDGTVGTLVAVITVLLFLYRRHVERFKSKFYPPLAKAGTWETVAKVSGKDFPWFLLQTARDLGTPIFRLPLPIPGPPMVVAVGDPGLCRAILDDPLTIKPKAIYKAFDDITGGYKSLFSNNGPFWHARRKGIAHGLSSHHVRRMNAVAMEKAEEWIATKLNSLYIPQNKSFDVGEEMIDLLISSITETAFEYCLSDAEKTMFKHERDLVRKEFLLKRTISPLRKLFGWFLPQRQRAYLASQRLHSLCLGIVQAYRALENPVKGTIIDLIMNNPAYLNDHERAADVQILLTAGHDTTAFSLAWTMKELALNPSIQSQLRESLRLYKQRKEDPNKSDLLHKVVREAMRLHPVAAGGSPREVGRDFQVPNKDGSKSMTIIPKGSIVFLPFILPLRNTDVYGDTADIYDPSRWDTDNNKISKTDKERMSAAFFPFSLGRQNCVGQPLALAQLYCILARIISEFELVLDEPGKTEFFLLLKPVGTMLKARKVL